MNSAMPQWEGFAIPVLTVLSDGRSRSLRELRDEVAESAGLTDAQRAATLPSGQSRFGNRVGWAASFLTRVDALRRPSRGRYEITALGRQLLADNPEGLTVHDIRALAKEGDEWWRQESSGRDDGASELVEEPTDLDPTEQVEQGVSRIHYEVASELLSRLVQQDSDFFEQAVVDLLLAMGYGGIGGKGLTTSRSHDGGIDGIIDQDVLGLNKVYVQAKRYGVGNAVGRPDVQGFVGALTGKADGGLFITTSRFSPQAIEWADGIPSRIILIDGKRLTELMIEYGVGVQVQHTYRVVEIDEDFFA